MKIYVITCGEYSDYQVCAATTDPERAEDMRRKASIASWYGEADIEEFDDGVFPDPNDDKIVPCKYYDVTLNPEREPEVRVYDEKAGKVASVRREVHKGPWMLMNKNGREVPVRECWYVYSVNHIQADDKEHAIKIASDMVAKWRAEHELEGQNEHH